MSALEFILILLVLAAIGAVAYKRLLGDDRRQRSIDSKRTDAMEHIAAPGVTDLDPTHFKP
jgi:hypothetical protein